MESRRHLAPRLLAGLQVGILGGLGTLAWLVILSAWYLRGPWTLVNLLAYATHAADNWELPFSMGTVVGISAHMFASGSMGIVAGWLLPLPRGRRRASLAALILGVLLSVLAYEVFWRRIAPALDQYVSPASMWMAHIIFGFGLAQFPRFYMRLEPDVGPYMPPLLPPPESDEETPEGD